MAKSEACEVFLEQEIKAALKEKKKPVEIGKELSEWLQNKMDVHITPDAVRCRAFRVRKKSGRSDQGANHIRKELVWALMKALKLLRKAEIGGKDEIALQTAIETAISIGKRNKEGESHGKKQREQP